MKKFWSILAVLLVVGPFATASADTMSVSQEIHIRGIVPPMRNIIVASSGAIMEITSNTPENVAPSVYLGSFTGPELPLTPSIMKDFKAKTKGVDMHSTDLHFALPNPIVAKSKKPNFLSALSLVSVLRYIRQY